MTEVQKYLPVTKQNMMDDLYLKVTQAKFFMKSICRIASVTFASPDGKIYKKKQRGKSGTTLFTTCKMHLSRLS